MPDLRRAKTMGELILMAVTVASVGGGAYWLGRASMRERVEFLLDELDEAVKDDLALLEARRTHPALRLVQDQ
jgi:hypothetical protein